VLFLNIVNSITLGLNNNKKNTAILISNNFSTKRKSFIDILKFDFDLSLFTGETLNKKNFNKINNPLPKPNI